MSNTASPLQADHSSPDHRCTECYLRGLLAEANDTRNLLQHEVSRLAQELARVTFRLSVERYRNLTTQIEKAVAAGDREQWARCVSERMGLGEAVAMAGAGAV